MKYEGIPTPFLFHHIIVRPSMTKEEKNNYLENEKLLKHKGLTTIHERIKFYRYLGLKYGDERRITTQEIKEYINQSTHLKLDKTGKAIPIKTMTIPYEINYTDQTLDDDLLYNNNYSPKKIMDDIEENMKTIHQSIREYQKENSTQRLETIIEQNNIMIRQNELLRRQNDTLTDLLKEVITLIYSL